MRHGRAAHLACSEATGVVTQRTFRDAVTEAGFEVGWQAVRRMPERSAHRLFDKLADRTWSKQGHGVRQLELNLGRVLSDASSSDIRHMSRLSMRSYFRYWCEAFRLPGWSPDRVNDTFRLMNSEPLRRYQSAGRGVIIVLGHSGNWDHAGAYACLNFGSLVTVAERLKPEGLFRKFIAYRESLGMEVLGHDQPDVIRHLARRLNEGKLVALVADRDLSTSGIPVTFFGEEARMPAGPAALALLTGAPILPVTQWFEPGVSCAQIEEEIVVPDSGTKVEKISNMTQQMATVFERGVRRHPVDWHMLQPFWQSDVVTQ